MNHPSHLVDGPATKNAVFVTGATGLLGNNLVRQLARDGFRVRALARSEEKAKRFLGDVDVELVIGDMRRISEFSARLDGCHAVFHTAAYFREYYQPGEHAEQLERINVQATLELMAEADRRGVAKFVHTSSSGAIGMKPDGSPGDEETAPSDEQLSNGYFRSKVVGDEKIRAWTPPHGMTVVEILPGWMWGPGDAAPTAAGQLALDFVAKKVPIVPEGGTCLVDARDVAAAMIACLERAPHGSRYIVGGEFRTIAEVLAILESLTGVKAPRLSVPYAAVMAFAFLEEQRVKLMGGKLLVSREAVRLLRWRHRVSSERAQRELGATFRPLSETLHDVVAWYAKHGFLKRDVTLTEKALA